MHRLLLPTLALITLLLPASAPQCANVFATWIGSAGSSEQRSSKHQQLVRGAYVRNVYRPSLTVLRPLCRHARGTAIVIAPGGGGIAGW